MLGLYYPPDIWNLDETLEHCRVMWKTELPDIRSDDDPTILTLSQVEARYHMTLEVDRWDEHLFFLQVTTPRGTLTFNFTLAWSALYADPEWLAAIEARQRWHGL
jgi:hypothetical protein